MPFTRFCRKRSCARCSVSRTFLDLMRYMLSRFSSPISSQLRLLRSGRAVLDLGNEISSEPPANPLGADATHTNSRNRNSSSLGIARSSSGIIQLVQIVACAPGSAISQRLRVLVFVAPLRSPRQHPLTGKPVRLIERLRQGTAYPPHKEGTGVLGSSIREYYFVPPSKGLVLP